MNRVQTEPALRGDLRCKDLLIEALTYHLLRPEQRLAAITPRCRPREPVDAPKVRIMILISIINPQKFYNTNLFSCLQVLLVVGGQAPKAIRSVECYDLQQGRWYHAAEMATRRCR